MCLSGKNGKRITQKYINKLVYRIIGCAIEVHRHLGPGLLESVYEKCLLEELKNSGFNVVSQQSLPLYYKEKYIGNHLRLDLLVEDLIVIELKAVEQMIAVYQAQLLSHLKLSKKPKGLLINFNCENVSKELVQLVTNEFAKLPKE